MKRWLIVAMIASLWGGFVQTASAADMGVPRTPPSPVPVPAAYDWSGVYIGGHIGGGWSTIAFADPSANSVLAACCVTLGGASGNDINPSAFLGGVHAGWMYQVARLVVGGDFDWSAMNMKGSNAVTFNSGSATNFGIET